MQLVGAFRLIVVATAGTPDTVLNGALRLRRTPRSFRQPSNREDERTPLIGSTDVPFDAIRLLTLAGRPSEDVPGEPPGVLFRYSPAARRARLDVGSGDGYDGSVTEDAGVLLHVFKADSRGFSGRWVSGGLGMLSTETVRPQGYFCAQRLPHARGAT